MSRGGEADLSFPPSLTFFLPRQKNSSADHEEKPDSPIPKEEETICTQGSSGLHQRHILNDNVNLLSYKPALKGETFFDLQDKPVIRPMGNDSSVIKKKDKKQKEFKKVDADSARSLHSASQAVRFSKFEGAKFESFEIQPACTREAHGNTFDSGEGRESQSPEIIKKIKERGENHGHLTCHTRKSERKKANFIKDDSTSSDTPNTNITSKSVQGILMPKPKDGCDDLHKRKGENIKHDSDGKQSEILLLNEQSFPKSKVTCVGQTCPSAATAQAKKVQALVQQFLPHDIQNSVGMLRTDMQEYDLNDQKDLDKNIDLGLEQSDISISKEGKTSSQYKPSGKTNVTAPAVTNASQIDTARKKPPPSHFNNLSNRQAKDIQKCDSLPTQNITSGKGHEYPDKQKEIPMYELSICFQIKQCFEEENLCKIIEGIFNSLSQISVHLSYISTQFLPKSRKTVCNFILISEDISRAKKILKIMVNKFNEKMKTKPSYSFKILQAETSSRDKNNSEISTRKLSEHSNRITGSHEDFSHKSTTKQKAVKKNTPEEEQAVKAKIQKAVQDIDKKMKEILQIHEKKIDETQKKINKYKERDSETLNERDTEDKRVLKQKLDELKMQKSEFTEHTKTYVNDLQLLDPSNAKLSDTYSALKCVGIEYNRLKTALPIYARRNDIIRQVQSHQVSVILGETGSGKSTQLAQYLYEAGFAECGSIICTQPRRIAAITLAERVANEMVEMVGSLVGYKAGTGSKSNRDTKIFFTTDHSLLNECLKDPEFRNYSCIIVDEAHERSIYTDILLGIIKSCLKRRPELKVIITSATIDPEVFIKYFCSGPELRVSGKTFPVDVFYHEDVRDDFENYEEKAVAKAVEIHNCEGPGDILIFLSSPTEIMRCCEEFEKRCRGKTNFKCLPLHGQLPPEEQKQVFEQLPFGQRKIVFATNCAETSITIDGIKYVIDTGVAKEMKYDPKRNMNQLGIHAISKSSANQRKGRAGRTGCGKCYRLYSKDSFDAMESINDPEILRVHLGQAVLKLSELGVDVRSYDFVQAPSDTAMNSAIDTLEYLNAIDNNQITDIGKWISKLPFDPKLGSVVYEAKKNNLLFDAVVLAAVLSSGSDLFFRGFTENEAQVVAKSKIDFGSEYGDPFTWLQVYKAWTDVNNKEKSQWCKSHCINKKCIGYVQQNIKDVTLILSKELGIFMKEEYSTDPNAMNGLRKMLFKATAASLSNFSEVSRAGYFSLVPERQVHIHPSSILAAMNLQPEWVVYTNLIRTSREFIKGITVVEEEWVDEIVKTGKLSIDVTKAKENKFFNVHREVVGLTIFHALVGPRFSNIQVLEEELLKSGLPRSVLEVKRDLGTLDIHSPFSMTQSAVDVFSKIKESTTAKLLSEDFEFSLNKKESIISSGTRVVIGSGGCVKSIFMPNQSDKVIIKRVTRSITEEDIIRKFEVFGEIKEIIPFKSHDPWGFVRYGSVAEALSAVEATCEDEFNAGMLKLDKHAKNVKNMFEAKMTWIRRPIKGNGTAFIKCDPIHESSLLGHTIYVNGVPCTIKMGKKGDLVIFKTGSLTESEVKDKVINSLIYENIDASEIEVTISREFVSEDDLKRKADHISSFIKRYINEDGFKVQMLNPKKGSIHYVCFLSFIDPVKGYEICRKIKHRLSVDGHPVEVSPCLKTSVHVPEKLKKACEERFKTLFSGLARYRATELIWKKLKKDFAIEIKSSRPSDIVEARDLICKEMEGEVIDCSINELLGSLLNKVGQEQLQKIEKAGGITIITDFRTGRIHMYGTESKITKTQQDINSYLTKIEGSEQGIVYMKGYDKPPGLMKYAMSKYGSLLENLVEEFKLHSVIINWKKHSIQIFGSKSDVEKAYESLAELEREAWAAVGSAKETSLPDCLVCMCPIEKKEFLYRLEVCGHAYCLDCLQHQVSFSVNNKEFPLSCAGDGCDSFFVWRDIKYALSKNWIKEKKLIDMAVNAFVLKNNSQYKFCLTPNCPVVYEITEDANGCEFNCPLCLASICTTCHIAFHAGMTCLMAKSGAKAENELSSWVAQNPSERKLCPGCRNPIEKIDGCNKMHCSICKTYFCWLCLNISRTEDECYRHLKKEHGGFF